VAIAFTVNESLVMPKGTKVLVDDKFCPATTDCPGALPLSAIGLVGTAECRGRQSS
jgi:hypothetical protein